MTIKELSRRRFLKSAGGLLFVPAFQILVPKARAANFFARPAVAGGISFVSATDTSGTAVASLTLASFVVSGTNRALFVSAAYLGDTPTITGVTFNGAESFTQLWQLDSGSGVFARSSGWILINPTATTANIVATFSAAGGGYSALGAVLLNGVNQTGTVGNSWRTPVTGSDASAPATVTASTAVSGDLVIDGVATYNGGGTISPNRTQRSLLDPVQGSNYAFGIQTHAASGSTAMTWTGADFWSQGAVAIIAA